MTNRNQTAFQHSLLRVTWLAGMLAALLLGLGSAWAQPKEELSLDDQYLQIFNLMDQGDVYGNNGKVEQALTKYRQAQKALLKIKLNQPNWSPAMVTFRLNYLAEKIATLSKSSATSSASTAAGTEAAPDSKAPTSASPVRLLNAGAEPRQVLRFHPQPGTKQTMTMTMSINMDMGAGQAMALPAMSLSFDCEVKEVASGGDITMGMVLSDVGVDEGSGGVPGMAAAIKAAMGGMKGLSTTSTLSDRGVTKDSQVQLPADTDPQARQMLESMKDSLGQLAVLLPEEAVGPGAKWEVRQPVKSQEMTIMQTATYQLISSEGDRLSLKSTVAQSAANQKIESPAMPGMKMDLVKMTGRASGEATIDLGQLLPAHASMDVQSEMNMNINMGNQKQPLQIKTGIKLLVETK